MTAYPEYPPHQGTPDYHQQQYQGQGSSHAPENYARSGYAEGYETPQDYQQQPPYQSYSSQYTSPPGNEPVQQSYGQHPDRPSVYGQNTQGSGYPPYGGTEYYSRENAINSYYSSPPPGPGYYDSFVKQEPNTPASSTFSPSQSDSPQYGPDGEDKGVMGAIGGGVAGAYAGHKVHHGFLGTLGGAFAGHRLEDAYKDHRKHSKPPSPTPGPPPIAPAPYPVHNAEPPPASMAGGFHMSSRSVQLDGDNNLIAECKKVDGRYRWSSLDLNDCLTNINGSFGWTRGGNFKASARHIRLVEGGNMLEAQLGDGRGGWNTSRIWLNEKIENRDGELRHLL